MKKDKYLIFGVVAIAIVVFFFVARWYKGKEAQRVEGIASANQELLIRPYSPRRGPDNAPVTIVEFFDPECEACRNFYPAVERVIKEFDGKVVLVLRYMTFHKNSAYAVSVLEAARKQGKYWEALDTLFAQQPNWASHEAPKPELILGYLGGIGLDVEKLKSSMQDAEIGSRILQDSADGRSLGVTRTPTFFVNGKQLTDLGYESLRAAVKNVQ